GSDIDPIVDIVNCAVHFSVCAVQRMRVAGTPPTRVTLRPTTLRLALYTWRIRMLHWIKRLAAVSAVSLLAACGSSNDDPAPPGTLAQVATSSGFNALVAAADKAGLVPAL